MVSISTVRTISIEARALGTEEATAKVRALGQAADGAAKSVDGIAIATETSARRQLSAMTAYDRVRQKVDDAYRAQVQLEKATAAVDRAHQQGKISASAYADAIAKIQAKYGAAAAGGGANSNNRLRGDQIQNLLYQGSDIVSSLGSGSNLTTVALQQGPQIAQVFAGPGGASIKGAFAAAQEAAAGLAARVGIAGGALGALATAGVAAAAAGMSYASSQRETEKALLGVGCASGVTAGQIAELAAANARAGGVSTRSARELATGYAATGRIGAETITGLIRTTKDFAATTGQDVPDAARMLAEAFADPTKGADALNERLGFLNDTTRETIQRLQAQGDRLGAQRALMEAYSGSLTKATDTMSGWGRVTETVGTTIGDIWDKIGRQVDRVVTGGSLEEQIAAARRTLENAQVAAEGGFGLFSSKDVERAQSAFDKLSAQAEKIRQQQEQREAARNSITIGNLIRSTQPDQAEIKKLQDNIEQLKKAIAEPAKFNLDIIGLYNANTAVGNLSRSFQALTEDVDKFGSKAVAAMNRAADLANRTVSYSPAARSAAEINDQFDQLERTADSRELAGLRRARATRLDTLQQETMRAAAQGGGSFSTSISQVPERFRSTIYDKAILYGQDPDLIASMIKRESSFNPRAVSPAGAQGIAQFMPRTAAAMGLSDPFDPVASIDAMARHVRDLNVKYGGSIPDILSGYNRGEPSTDRWIRNGRDPSTMPKETRDYIAAITTKGPSTVETVKAEQERTAELQRQRQVVQDNNELYGRNSVALEARIAAEERLQRDQLRGVEITDAYREAVKKSEQDKAETARALAATRFGRDLDFERDQLGRAAGDQSAFARARSQYGDTSSKPAEAAIGRIRELDTLKEARSTFQDTFGGVITSLSRGATAAQAASSVFGQLADKFIKFGVDQIGGSLFSKGGAIASLFGFADGGIMTSGGALPLHRYATGGIANSPQLALFGEGRGPEAFVPLPDGRRIPVAVTGAPANQNPSVTDARSYSFDLSGSNLSEAQVRAALTQAIAANNQERDRTHFERVEALRRMSS